MRATQIIFGILILGLLVFGVGCSKAVKNQEPVNDQDVVSGGGQAENVGMLVPSEDGQAAEDVEEHVVNEEGSAEEPAVDAGKRIEVSAFRFGYSPDPLVLKKGEPVMLVISTKDVSHGFYVPDLGIDLQIQPGQTQEFSFTPDKTGTFEIVCTVPCGGGHSSMRGTLIVEE